MPFVISFTRRDWCASHVSTRCNILRIVLSIFLLLCNCCGCGMSPFCHHYHLHAMQAQNFRSTRWPIAPVVGHRESNTNRTKYIPFNLTNAQLNGTHSIGDLWQHRKTVSPTTKNVSGKNAHFCLGVVPFLSHTNVLSIMISLNHYRFCSLSDVQPIRGFMVFEFVYTFNQLSNKKWQIFIT